MGKEKIILKVEEFPISVRSIKTLKEAGFNYETDFETVSEKQLLKIEGFGIVGLTELKVFLKGRGIKLLKVKKERKVNHPKARDLVRHLLHQKPTPREISIANKLLEKYTFEELSRINIERQVNSLTYFMAGAGTWLDALIHKNAPAQLVKSDIEYFQETELREILPEPEKIRKVSPPPPMSLKDFLNIKK